MPSDNAIKAARKYITTENKVYMLSDGNTHIVDRSRDISEILNHARKNKLTVFDVEENKEVELKKSKE